MSTVSFRHLILGLLARQPMSGYDIGRFLKGLGWLIGTPSYGGLYPALHGLLADGLATVEVLPTPGKPPRKIYRLTAGGRRELADWTGRPPAPEAPLRAFLLRLLLAADDTPAAVAALLQQRRGQVALQREALALMAAAPADRGDEGRRLALDYAVALAEAELAWLDGALTRLPQEPPTA